MYILPELEIVGSRNLGGNLDSQGPPLLLPPLLSKEPSDVGDDVIVFLLDVDLAMDNIAAVGAGALPLVVLLLLLLDDVIVEDRLGGGGELIPPSETISDPVADA